MKKNICKAVAILMAVAMVMGLSACGSGADYDAYAAAYKKVKAEGGMDVDLKATLTMDGTDKEATGNFKVDMSDAEKTILFLTVDMDGDEITQFSDGEYLYTDARGSKTKFKLGEKSQQEGARTKGEDDPEPTEENAAAPEFNSESFLEEFASFLEAGKIQELGLLDPIAKAAVTETTCEGNVYTLKVNNQITEKYLNTLSQSVMADEDETVEVKDLKDFVYTATVENDFVTGFTCSGSMTVIVPASISSSGEETSYDLTLNISATFNNPGEKVTISLPSTDGYEG